MRRTSRHCGPRAPRYCAATVALFLVLGCGEDSSSGDGNNSGPFGPLDTTTDSDGTTTVSGTPGAEADGPLIAEPDTDADGEPQAGGDGTSCIELDVQAERVTPTVLLLLDQSGSMQESFGGSTRWDTLRETLVDPTSGIIPRFEQDISFGIATYTSFDGNTDGAECPILETMPVGTGTATSAADFLGDSSDLVGDSDTPTAESIVAATSMLAATNNGGPRAIILATDGNPDDCDQPDSHGPEQQAASVAAVRAALDQNIETYVISVGDQVARNHLQDLANAGIGVDSGARYYEALDAAALADAFNEIIFGVTPCEFELNGTVAAADARLGTVVIGGSPVAYQDENGWDMPTTSSVALSGSACEAAKAGGLVEIDFPCKTFVPNPTVK